MRVVDTSLWIEYAAEGSLADYAEQTVLPLASCIVPAMVHYEMAKWCNRVLSDEDAGRVMSLLTECVSADMNAAVATEAALLSARHKLHATDAIIYATAQVAGATLHTSDSHFKGLPGVDYLEKPTV